MTKLIVALLFVGLNLYTYSYFADEDFIPERETFESFPLSIEEWRCTERLEMDKEIVDILGVTDYMLCNFADREAESWANVYIGYHQTQTRSTSKGETLIHPPEHCLPGGGWDIIKSDIVPIDFGTPGEAKRVVVAKGNQRSLVYFWYQSRGRVIARNHEKVLYMFMDRAVSRRTDGSLVRFTVPIQHGDEDGAEAVFQSLAASLAPLLPMYVPN
jgi:EpsI family protein